MNTILQERKGHGFTSVIAMSVMAGILFACAGRIQQPTAGLNETARHTGTLTLLRIDDSWHPEPEKRSNYLIGQGYAKRGPRFVPVRGKLDYAGLDGADRILTNQDVVTITLNSAFIKYFRELGGATRAGEIAVVISFDAGTTVKQSLLIHSSRGQTLGSFLDLQDWTAIGPIKIDGDALRIRVVVIELDQKENAAMTKFVRSLAGFAGSLQPQLGPAFSIAQSVAEFIISQNADDVVVDQKFTLQRVQSDKMTDKPPLLYGTYAMVMQEDELAAPGAKLVAPQSVRVPVQDRIRYDRRFGRLYKVYNYLPSFDTPPCGEGQLFSEASAPVDWDLFYPAPALSEEEANKRSEKWSDAEFRKCIYNKLLDGEEAQKFREEELGYTNGSVVGRFVYPTRDWALKVAYVESIRHVPVTKREVHDFGDTLSRIFPDAAPEGSIKFTYAVTDFPIAYTLLAQYSMHTHLIFSIDRSLGGNGSPVHNQFQTFQTFMQSELASVETDTRFDNIIKTIGATLKQNKKQRKLLRQIANMRPEDNETKEVFALRKVCRLWQQGLGEVKGTDVLSDAPIYNEIFHLSGREFFSANEVVAYLKEEGATVDAKKRTCNVPKVD